MGVILVTGRGAIWAEHVTGFGYTDTGTLTAVTKDGTRHPIVDYHGSRPLDVAACMLQQVEELIMWAARFGTKGRTHLISVDTDLRLRLTVRDPDTWQLIEQHQRRSLIFADTPDPGQTPDPEPEPPDPENPDTDEPEPS